MDPARARELLVRERERGIWEALLATPVDALDALVGKLAPYVLIGTLQGATVIGIARLLFDLPLPAGLAHERLMPLRNPGQGLVVADLERGLAARALLSGDRPVEEA